MSARAVAAAVGMLLLTACGNGSRPASSSSATTSAGRSTVSPTSSAPASTTAGTSTSAPFRITSSAFGNGTAIPATYSCSGANQSPPLAWRGVPARAVELALVVDDPDAVGGRYVHWVVVGIGAKTGAIPQGATPPGARVLPNSGGESAYLGPCPPPGTGTHHYRFTLYALRAHPQLGPGTPALTADATIQRSALAKAQLVGLYAS